MILWTWLDIVLQIRSIISSNFSIVSWGPCLVQILSHWIKNQQYLDSFEFETLFRDHWKENPALENNSVRNIENYLNNFTLEVEICKTLNTSSSLLLGQQTSDPNNWVDYQIRSLVWMCFFWCHSTYMNSLNESLFLYSF